MITRSSINTKFIYFIMYTRLDEVDTTLSTDNSSLKENILDKVLEDLSDNHKLIDHPFLWALSALRSDEKLEIEYISSKEDFFTKALIENLNPLSIFKNVEMLEEE